MNFIRPKRRKEIHSMRVRRGFGGKAIVQVRYALEQVENMAAPETVWVPAGLTKWEDMNYDDASEVQEVMICLGNY